MVMKAKDPWTGTNGVLVSDLPEDWDEATCVLRERSQSQPLVDSEYTSEIAERAVKWLFEQFGNDPGLYQFSIAEAIEWYVTL